MRRLTALVIQATLLASLLSLAGPGSVAAACIVDDGANNGTDSGAEFGLVGFPGFDAGPANDQGSWAPDNIWHDSWLKEWCEPSHDWIHDNYIRWSGARWDKIQQFKTTRRIAQDVNIAPAESYNWAFQASSTLPWDYFYNADIFEQWNQGYEEISFLISDVTRIGKGTNYNTRSKWDQEGTALNWVDSKSQWTDNAWYETFQWDKIGRIDAKKFNQ
jgi:hypothetical protein